MLLLLLTEPILRFWRTFLVLHPGCILQNLLTLFKSIIRIVLVCFVLNFASKLSKPESIGDRPRARDWNYYVFISYAPPSGGLGLARKRKSRLRQPMGFHITSGYRMVRPTFRIARRDEKEERKLLIPNNCWLQVSIQRRTSLPVVAHFLPSCFRE